MSGLYAVGVRVMVESRSVMGIITDFCWTNSDGGSWVYDVLTDGGQTLPRVFERYLRLPDGTRPVAHTDVDGEALRILVERATRAERERDEARAELSMAYTRALQAAAGVARQSASLASRDGAYSEAESLIQLGRDILALTPEDIDRITKEHDHG